MHTLLSRLFALVFVLIALLVIPMLLQLNGCMGLLTAFKGHGNFDILQIINGCGGYIEHTFEPRLVAEPAAIFKKRF